MRECIIQPAKIVCMIAVFVVLSGQATFEQIGKNDKLLAGMGEEVVRLKGPIKEGLANEFLSTPLSSRTIIELDSTGGVLTDALSIAYAINLAGATTFVPRNAECLSACALIWLAGGERVASRSARIGFHGAYVIDSVPITSMNGNMKIGVYLSKLSLDYAAIDFITKASPSEFRWLNEDYATLLGIKVRWE